MQSSNDGGEQRDGDLARARQALEELRTRLRRVPQRLAGAPRGEAEQGHHGVAMHDSNHTPLLRSPEHRVRGARYRGYGA